MINRRNFLLHCIQGATISSFSIFPSLSFAQSISNSSKKIKAIAFDAFPIFDPRAAFKVIMQEYPEEGEELRKVWFDKIFAYTWLRTSGEKYKDFWSVMDDALEFSAASLKIDLTSLKKKKILDSFLTLPVWPDVVPALKELKQNNIRLAFLSNMTEEMLIRNIEHNEIDQYFEFVLSTDRVQAFKPDPKAYQLAVDVFSLEKDEIGFAAFAGWDASGADWFGYQSIWVNRLGFPLEILDASPARIGKDMSVIVDAI